MDNPYKKRKAEISDETIDNSDDEDDQDKKCAADPNMVPESPAEKQLKKARYLCGRKFDALMGYGLSQPPPKTLKNLMKPVQDLDRIVDLTEETRVSLSFMMVANGYFGLVKCVRTGTMLNAGTTAIIDAIKDKHHGIMDEVQHEFLDTSGFVASCPVRKGFYENRAVETYCDILEENVKEKYFVVSLEHRCVMDVLRAFDKVRPSRLLPFTYDYFLTIYVSSSS